MTNLMGTAMQSMQTGLNTQQILQYLEGDWEDLHSPSFSVLKRIMSFVADVRVPHYKVAMLKKVAEYLVSNLNLHILNMFAIFAENAELEGISAKHREETLNYVMPQFIRIMEEVNDRLAIKSLDDLATLANITTGLEMLSETDSADSAQNWLYELPILYYDRLQEVGLLSDRPAFAGQNDWVGQTQRFVHRLIPFCRQESKLVDASGTSSSNTYVRASLKSDSAPIATRA